MLIWLLKKERNIMKLNLSQIFDEYCQEDNFVHVCQCEVSFQHNTATRYHWKTLEERLSVWKQWVSSELKSSWCELRVQRVSYDTFSRARWSFLILLTFGGTWYVFSTVFCLSWLGSHLGWAVSSSDISAAARSTRSPSRFLAVISSAAARPAITGATEIRTTLYCWTKVRYPFKW